MHRFLEGKVGNIVEIIFKSCAVASCTGFCRFAFFLRRSAAACNAGANRFQANPRSHSGGNLRR